MKTKAIVFAAAILSVGVSSSAFAQQYGHDRNDRNERHEQRDGRDDRNNDRHDGRYDNRYDNRNQGRDHDNRNDQRYDRRDHDRDGYRVGYRGAVYSQRGAGPRYDLYQGNRLPSAYHGDRYVVNDWQRYRLSAPQRGTHWVRAGNDYVLVALATGIIAQVLLNN